MDIGYIKTTNLELGVSPMWVSKATCWCLGDMFSTREEEEGKKCGFHGDHSALIEGGPAEPPQQKTKINGTICRNAAV